MLTSLRFSLPNIILDNSLQGMKKAAQEMKKLAHKSGTDNPEFLLAWKQAYDGLCQGIPIEQLIQNKYHVRAVGLMLTAPKGKYKITLSQKLLERISSVVKAIPMTLLESVYQRFLTDFSRLNDLRFICSWLKKNRIQKNHNTLFDEVLIHENGPKHLVDIALRERIDLQDAVSKVELQDYASGQFIQDAQKIYYLEQLRRIPENKPHDLLNEVAKSDVYEGRYDQESLLGHHILDILISRAPKTGIDDSWLNVIMAIAGDPRVPVGNQRYTKWWSHISEDLRKKVRGWLSGLDLKLFLAALKDFAESSNKHDLQRMFPSRKRFLEGLYDKGLIVETRLFLSRDADSFLKRAFDEKHLPVYDIIKDGYISVIYVELQQGCIVEGSHNCALRVFEKISDKSVIKAGASKPIKYYDLTTGLVRHMYRLDEFPVAEIRHDPNNFNWQRKTVDSLQRLGLNIMMRDALTTEDYKIYKRRFGVG